MPFDQQISIIDNAQLRIPQREGWIAIRDHFARPNPTREVGVVLPVGCGKSGLIAIAPYAVGARRALVIAPGTRIRGQLGADLRSNSETNFYQRRAKETLGVDAEDGARNIVFGTGKENGAAYPAFWEINDTVANVVITAWRSLLRRPA